MPRRWDGFRSGHPGTPWTERERAAAVLTRFTEYHLEFLVDRAVNTTFECELIVREQAVNELLRSYAENLDALLSTESNARVWSTENPTEYGVLIVDADLVHIIGYRRDGGLTAFITDDSNAAVEWAENVFVQCRHAGHEVSFRGDADNTAIDDRLKSFVFDG